MEEENPYRAPMSELFEPGPAPRPKGNSPDFIGAILGACLGALIAKGLSKVVFNGLTPAEGLLFVVGGSVLGTILARAISKTRARGRDA